MPNRATLFCLLLAQTAIGLTGVSPAYDGTTTWEPGHPPLQYFSDRSIPSHVFPTTEPQM